MRTRDFLTEVLADSLQNLVQGFSWDVERKILRVDDTLYEVRYSGMRSSQAPMMITYWYHTTFWDFFFDSEHTHILDVFCHQASIHAFLTKRCFLLIFVKKSATTNSLEKTRPSHRKIVKSIKWLIPVMNRCFTKRLCEFVASLKHAERGVSSPAAFGLHPQSMDFLAHD